MIASEDSYGGHYYLLEYLYLVKVAASLAFVNQEEYQVNLCYPLHLTLAACHKLLVIPSLNVNTSNKLIEVNLE